MECAAIVWAIKTNRQLFYGIHFVVVSDHQPLKNSESLSTKVNRVQRWFDFLSACTYTLEYRPGKKNGNSDLLSRLPLPATEADNHPDVRLPDPEDIDMYLTGASGLQSRFPEPLSSSSCRIEDLTPELEFEREEKELRIDSFTTNEEADRVWHVIQNERIKRKSTKVEPHRRFTIPDNTPPVSYTHLTLPTIYSV